MKGNADARLPELVKQAKSGSHAAFTEIVKQVMKPIIAFTYRMTRDTEAATDLAQETFVAAWENLRQLRTPERFRSWLFSIANNKAMSYLDRINRERSVPEDELPVSGSAETPEQHFSRKELQQQVLAFMQSLPTQQRRVFDLRFYGGQSFEEIASITGKAVGTVKTHYRQAVARLRMYARERRLHE